MVTVSRVYRQTGKLVEKYDVIATNQPGGGGEYPTQDGFGWTNGVMLKLMALYPADAEVTNADLCPAARGRVSFGAPNDVHRVPTGLRPGGLAMTISSQIAKSALEGLEGRLVV